MKSMPNKVDKTKGFAVKRFAEGGDVPKDEVLEEIKKTEWYKEFTEEYGEPPDLETSDYDYRKAWQAGIRPERDPYDNNKYHWASSDPATGEMLKAEDHPTAWKEYYMRETGKNPDEVGATKEDYEQLKAPKEFAKGGIVENEMNKLFAEGGVMQEGGTVDPVSGNEVPPGAMAEEVRDDIDAKLSEGEFVFPADVVRFIGLQTLMKLRDKAKAGLKRMEEIGQMGNAEEVENAEALFGGEEMDDEMFSNEIDSIMAEED
jgi:hypothetical protein